MSSDDAPATKSESGAGIPPRVRVGGRTHSPGVTLVFPSPGRNWEGAGSWFEGIPRRSFVLSELGSPLPSQESASMRRDPLPSDLEIVLTTETGSIQARSLVTREVRSSLVKCPEVRVLRGAQGVSGQCNLLLSTSAHRNLPQASLFVVPYRP